MKVQLLIVVALIAGLGVSACGKKGPLEPPKPSVVSPAAGR
jgi:predicted small lipoprotein YifL